MASRLLLALMLLMAAPVAAQTPGEADPIGPFLDRLRDLTIKGQLDTAGIGITSSQGSSIAEFVDVMTPVPTEVVIKERDRTPLLSGGQRLLLEVFSAVGIEGRVGTWQVDLRLADGAAPADPTAWRIVRMDRLAVAAGLYRLSLDATRQFDVKDLTVKGPDLALQLPSGTAFVATVPDGPTAVVLLGRGRMRFSPPDPAERTQLRIFAGSEQLDAEFDATLIRVRPGDFAEMFPAGTLMPKPPVSKDVRRANAYFEDYIGRSLRLDLNDLSRERWSLVPQFGDLIAEVRTRRYGNLTYARAGADPEDVTVFDRRRRKNISVYASAEKLALRGRFFSEDDLVDYDILTYDVDAEFTPDRLWVDGRARLGVKIVAPVVSGLTLKIAEPLTVRSIVSPELGRLMYLRVVGQNSVLVNLPVPLPRNTTLSLEVIYSGRIEPQQLDREAITLDQDQPPETFVVEAEPRFIYSNRSYWYPQSTVTDYAIGRLRITVPPEYDVIATGTPSGPPAPAPGAVKPGDRPRRVFVFAASQPVRYLACVISRFNTVTTAELQLPSLDEAERAIPPPPKPHGPLTREEDRRAPMSLVVQANPRQTSRGRGMADRTTAIFNFYASLVGEAPYSSFTVALSENDLPGGHSPAYFAILNQPLPTSPLVWRNDPVSFDTYPSFFLAHELAHQWWGQAVGWKNYHEQWLSEGFAQYFAAMYAEQERGPGVFDDVIRQMRRWAIEDSSQGPVYLGYRLGHIKSDGRVFRAIIYNKSALVLHMLRRLIGDDAFFRGVRKFYADWRFRKAGTGDLRKAMEQASGQNLEPFFDAWIFRSEIPRIQFGYTVQGSTVHVTLRQKQDPAVPVPVTVTLTYTNGAPDRIVVPVTEAVVTRELTAKPGLREVLVNQDQAALALFEK